MKRFKSVFNPYIDNDQKEVNKDVEVCVTVNADNVSQAIEMSLAKQDIVSKSKLMRVFQFDAHCHRWIRVWSHTD